MLNITVFPNFNTIPNYLINNDVKKGDHLEICIFVSDLTFLYGISDMIIKVLWVLQLENRKGHSIYTFQLNCYKFIDTIKI